MNLDPEDAAELAGLLQLIVGRTASDRDHMTASLPDYAGDVPYGPDSPASTWPNLSTG